MKILIISDYGYIEGGVETGIIQRNEIFRKKGHTVKTITSDAEPELAHFSDFEFSAIPQNGFFKKLLTIAFNVSSYKVTKKALSEYKPDIVLLHTMHQPTASVLYLLKKYPSILFVHGPEVYTRSLLPWHLSIQDYKHGRYDLNDLTLLGKLHYYYFKYICGLLYKYGLKNVNTIVALSRYTQQLLERESLHAQYIPNGVKLLPYTQQTHKLPGLLYAGRIESYKGVDDLIEAMPEIIKYNPDIKLRIAGSGKFEDSIKYKVDKLGLKKSVEFLGHIDENRLAKEYKRCAIFVMPSRWPETFGKVGIEAMSVGRPVISTNVGGIREWLHHNKNGLLVKPYQPHEIARSVMRILSDDKVARRMSKSAQTTASLYSMEKFADNIELMANKLLDSQRTLH